jgi:membrane-bound lytic murein transglycosylase D
VVVYLPVRAAQASGRTVRATAGKDAPRSAAAKRTAPAPSRKGGAPSKVKRR